MTDNPLLVGYLGGQLQGPDTGRLAKLSRVLMQHLFQALSLLLIEGRLDVVRPR